MKVAAAEGHRQIAHRRISNASAERRYPLTIVFRAFGIFSLADADQRIVLCQRERIPIVFRHRRGGTGRRKIDVIQTVLIVKVHVRVATTWTSDGIAHDWSAERNERASVIG